MRIGTLLLAAAVSAALASGADVAGPVAGYVYDTASQAIRPISGIPGAALLGDALDLGFQAAGAAIAPEQDYAVATGADNGVRLVRLPGRTVQAFETLHGAPLRVVFSPRGASAVLVNDASMDVYTGLPDKPVLARTLDPGASGAPSSVAVSDDGSTVLASSPDAVRVAGESAGWRTVMPGQWVFAFAPSSRDAVLAGAGGALALLRDVAGAADRKDLAAGSGDAPTPSAVAWVAEGRIVVAQGSKLFVLSDSGELLASHVCDCAPSGLTRMGSVFRLVETSDAPLWLLDGASRESRLVFVPAVRRTQPAGSE